MTLLHHGQTVRVQPGEPISLDVPPSPVLDTPRQPAGREPLRFARLPGAGGGQPTHGTGSSAGGSASAGGGHAGATRGDGVHFADGSRRDATGLGARPSGLVDG